MQVRCNEGLANHIGPEPCIGPREGVGEASVGESIGQPLSRERNESPNADAVSEVEGHVAVHVIASAQPIGRGRRPWHVQTLLVREPGDLRSDLSDLCRAGPCCEGEEP